MTVFSQNSIQYVIISFCYLNLLTLTKYLFGETKKLICDTNTHNLKRLLAELELIVMLKRSLAYIDMQTP